SSPFSTSLSIISLVVSAVVAAAPTPARKIFLTPSPNSIGHPSFLFGFAAFLVTSILTLKIIEDNGKRPVIYKGNSHLCPEFTCFHHRYFASALSDHIFIESFRCLRIPRFNK